ncbi:MAG: response regulator [candidate division Zixibacteria bacterium]|nr:response regulator [candidate division Zixibacteria bacterium]
MSRNAMLIVDDEENILKSLKRLFVGMEYKIYTAPSGEEALEILEDKKVQLVISDYRMPGMNGVEFLSKIKKMYPDTIRIILSGYADVAAIVNAVNEGEIYKFISKPWNDQELTTTIMRSFEQHNLQKENLSLNKELQQRNEELEELANSLEQKVESRTRAIEMKNRALKIARNILSLLPVGVIGVDSEDIIVYYNNVLSKYMEVSGLALGMPADTLLSDRYHKLLRSSLESLKPEFLEIREGAGWMMALPLPNGVGVIGLFGHQGDFEEIKKQYIKYAEMSSKKEVVNV